MVHAITPCISRAGLACLVLLLGWVMAVPSWATSAPGPVPAGRFRLWHDGAASSLIPAVYTGYGLVPALVVGTSAAFIGVSRMAGNKHYLSDVLAGYAIGLGWGLPSS